MFSLVFYRTLRGAGASRGLINQDMFRDLDRAWQRENTGRGSATGSGSDSEVAMLPSDESDDGTIGSVGSMEGVCMTREAKARMRQERGWDLETSGWLFGLEGE